uniref:Uncharacterized protein n=1 Tax=Octactis speculum TaxID=3111310 RepID=A0A7S2F1L7_9STRA
MVNMTRSLLPLMKHRKRGAIINVSSGSCAQPSPYLATYASSKAFGKHFSMSTNRENKKHGITALCIRPYYISGTGLYANPKPALNAPAASTIVAGALSSLGRCEVTFSYNVHALMGFIFGTVWEDPIFGPLLAIPAKKLNLNGTMLKLQEAARARTQRKSTAMWEAVFARSKSQLAEYNLESSVSAAIRSKQE